MRPIHIRVIHTPKPSRFQSAALTHGPLRRLQLSISEKGFKKMVELFKHYKDTLHDPAVLACFQVRPLRSPKP